MVYHSILVKQLQNYSLLNTYKPNKIKKYIISSLQRLHFTTFSSSIFPSSYLNFQQYISNQNETHTIQHLHLCSYLPSLDFLFVINFLLKLRRRGWERERDRVCLGWYSYHFVLDCSILIGTNNSFVLFWVVIPFSTLSFSSPFSSSKLHRFNQWVYLTKGLLWWRKMRVKIKWKERKWGKEKWREKL